MPRPKTSVRALGEIALRVKDLDAMQRFYEEVIGLELMRRFPDSAFFRIASGFGGHTQILALFDRSERIARGVIGRRRRYVHHRSHCVRDSAR